MTVHAFDQSMPAYTQIDQLIDHGAITPVYQPIVELRGHTIVGYEALARSDIKGLERPDVMFRAATQLNLQVRLSSICRLKSVTESASLPGNPNLYLNIHRDEDLMTDVFESMKLIRKSFPDRKMTVEIHESSVPGPMQMQDFRSALNELDIQLAFDDFGVGQSRLMDLIEVPPDVLKFDISLVQNIDRAHERHLKWIQSLLAATRQLGVRALAEGIETAAEAASCRDLGFDLAQGYHFGTTETGQSIRPVSECGSSAESDSQDRIVVHEQSHLSIEGSSGGLDSSHVFARSAASLETQLHQHNSARTDWHPHDRLCVRV